MSDIAQRVCTELEFVTLRPHPERRMEDLGLDSLDFAQLHSDLEEEFKIQIGIEEMAACETVADLIKLIEGKC